MKYFSPDTNYDALERELTGHDHLDDQRVPDLDKWAEYVEDDGTQGRSAV